MLKNKRILLCRIRNNNWYFLPGGHVNWGEEITRGLFRELQEELGIKVRRASFIGVAENIYIWKGKRHHEINIVFHIPTFALPVKSKESHLELEFLPVEKLGKARILPPSLKKAIHGWLKNKKHFWVSEFRK